MNYRRLLHSTFLLALGLGTIGNVNGQKRMPPPRVYGAITIVWWILGIVADLGPRLARLAGVFSVVLTLTMLTGKAGARAIKWLQDRAVQFGGPGALSPSGTGAAGTLGGGLFSGIIGVAQNLGRAPAPSGASAAGAAAARPVLQRRTVSRPRRQRDLTPQFPSKAAYDEAVRLNPDPAHLIPHMIVQEGGAIKYEDIRGGSDTEDINTLRRRRR